MGIEIHLLGTPRIQVDGKDIFFTYGKVQALIYYMVVKGVALRDEISGLLWPEKSEAKARKNLRNAIYEAKNYWEQMYLYRRGMLYYSGIPQRISMWMSISFKGIPNNM